MKTYGAKKPDLRTCRYGCCGAKYSRRSGQSRNHKRVIHSTLRAKARAEAKRQCAEEV